MTQTDRDRLVALKKAGDKKITQRQAAEELNLTERHVRRLLRLLKQRGDRALVREKRQSSRPACRKSGVVSPTPKEFSPRRST